MSSKNRKNPSKSASPPENSQDSQFAGTDRSQSLGLPSEKTPQVKRMETFPKTNTIPKKWDLSSFAKS